MIRFFADRRWFWHATKGALAVAIMITLAQSACTSPDDNGNANDNQNTNDNGNGNGNGNTNDNQNINDNGVGGGPDSGEIFIEFDLTDSGSLLAQALGGDATEFGFFGNKDAGAASADLTQIDVLLPTSVAVRASVDVSGRPSQVLASDGSALLLNYDDIAKEVTSTFVATDGQTTQATTPLGASAARQTSQVVFGLNDLCAALADFAAVTDSVFASCDSKPEGAGCLGSIHTASEDLASFCLAQVSQVVATLPANTGQGPALSVPLGVVVTADADEVTPGTGISLRGGVFGGAPPYLFDWEVLEGSPATPEVTATSAGSISTASLELALEGVFTIRLQIFDSAAGVAFFDKVVIAAAEPGALAVEIEAESSSDAFEVALIAQASGGAPPYTFSWTRLDGPGTVTFDPQAGASTTAAFESGGNYILQVEITDALGESTLGSVPVTIVDPDTSLAVEIDFPLCGQSTLQDTCVALASDCLADCPSIELSAVVSNASGAEALAFVWEVIDGANSAILTDQDSETVTLTAIGFDTLTVQVTVEDQGTSQTATVSGTIEVIQDLDLVVDIFSDGNATLNQPETLLSQVTGAIGQLSYLWEVVADGTGSFEDAAAQNVQFTPTTRPSVTVKVTASDASTGKTAIAEEVLSVSTFAVTIVGDAEIPRNQVSLFSPLLSGDAPGSVSFGWLVANEDPDDSLDLSLVGQDGSALQVLPEGDGLFALSLTAIDQADAGAACSSQSPCQQGDVCVVGHCASQCAGDSDCAEGLSCHLGGCLGNFATDTTSVEVVCSNADLPSADAGTDQTAQPSNPDAVVVTLFCEDPDQSSEPCENGDLTVERCFRWQQVGGDPVNLINEFTSAAAFTMPATTNLAFEPLQFECIVQNNATLCETSDGIIVYAEPVAGPAGNSEDQTVLVGSRVTVSCEQLSGSTGVAPVFVVNPTLCDEHADCDDGKFCNGEERCLGAACAAGTNPCANNEICNEAADACLPTFEWRQVESNGDPVDAAEQVADFTVTNGELTFTAPSTSQDLFFECRAVILDADGNLPGPFSSDNPAKVQVHDFDVAKLVRNGDAAEDGSLVSIEVDGVRLTNTAPGDMVFAGRLNGINDSGVFQSDLQGSIAALVRQEQAAPGGGRIGQVSLFDIDDTGTLVFVAPISAAPAGGEDKGVFATAGGIVTEIAANGSADQNPAGNNYCDFDGVAISGTGVVSFVAQFGDPTGCAGTIRQGVYAQQAGSTTAVAESGSTIVPDSIPGVLFGDFFEQLHSNAAGDIIFAGRDGAGTALGAFIESPNANLDSVFLNNRVAADTNEVYAAQLPADMSIDKSGVVTFQAGLIGSAGEPTSGLFSSVGPLGTVKVLNGSGSPAGFSLSSFQAVAANDLGDLAFIVDGRLLFYSSATGTVVEVRNASGVAVRNGFEVVDGITLNQLAEVQLNDAGTLIFSATLSGGGTAVFLASTPG